MAIATVNRTLQRLRATGSVDFRDAALTIRNWDRLVKIGQFVPRYLHLKRYRRFRTPIAASRRCYLIK
jgi:hypothetical protein